jgi:hypothetical protein
MDVAHTAGPRESPRIASLQQQLGAGRGAAVDAFWRDVEARGAPLIEPLADDGHALVAFVWRARDHRDRPAVITQLAPRLHGTGAAPLTRLPGSDVWYATFRARSDLRTTYWLSVSTAATTGTGDEWITDDTNWRADPPNPHTTPEQPPASLLALPDSPPVRWSAARTGARGHVEARTIGSDVLPNERTAWVYTPPGYDPTAGPNALLLLFDGWAYANCVPTATILDNLGRTATSPGPVMAIECHNEIPARRPPCPSRPRVKSQA